MGVGNASARAVVGGGGFRPLVSVVLPTRDRTERLAGALASVVAQSYRQLEIIVVDDASASPVADVIDRVAGDDPRVELMCLATHRGAASARNAALERCSGDVVGFLDDDDRWEPHKIERQVEFLAAHPTVGIVSCDYYVVDERSGHSGSLYRGPTSFSAQQLQWMNFPGSFSFVMARRDLLGDELHIDESFPSVEDWDLWLRCTRRAPAGVVGEPLCRHTVHGGAHLSHPASEIRGQQRFVDKHGEGMPPECRAYAMAHLRMLRGTGWGHRAQVVRSLATGSARASAVLALEQLARQLGRARGDPGLVARALVRVIGPDGRAAPAAARRRQVP